jgi:hypothetical protein
MISSWIPLQNAPPVLAMRRYETRHRRALCRYTTQTSDRVGLKKTISQKYVQSPQKKKAK